MQLRWNLISRRTFVGFGFRRTCDGLDLDALALVLDRDALALVLNLDALGLNWIATHNETSVEWRKCVGLI